MRAPPERDELAVSATPDHDRQGAIEHAADAGPSPAQVDRMLGAPLSVGKTPKSADDWQATRPSEPTWFKARIGTRPNVDSIDLKLGADHRQAFFIANEVPARGDFQFQWRHTARNATVIHGADADTGPESTARYLVSRPGTATIGTQLKQTGGGRTVRIDGPETELKVAKPTMKIHKMFSTHERGSVPVIDTMQQGEQLHVIAHVTDLDPELASGRAQFAGSGLKVVDTKGRGNGTYEITLTPSRTGQASGTLKVMPANASASDVDGARLDLAVAEMDGEHDFGGRPSDTADALTRVERGWQQVFENRKTAVTALYEQLKLVDPPPATPLWKQFVLGAAELALNAATAGIGARVAKRAMDFVSGGDGTQEFIKVMTEGSLNGIIGLTGADKEMDKQRDASLAITFKTVQELALASASRSVVNKYMTSAKARASSLDAKDPGRGYEDAVAHERAVVAMTGDPAVEQQTGESFEAWCTLLAKNALGSTEAGAKHARDADRMLQRGGTDLSTVVDAGRITDDVSEQDPTVRLRSPGLERTPGVLRLELMKFPARTNEGAPLLGIKSSRIEGLKNDAVIRNILQRSLGELDMPVVARYNDDKESGFVVGRNEAREHWASEDRSTTLSTRYKGVAPKDAAAKIFEELADNRIIGTKRG